jgi:hypothetical protein
MYTPWPEIGTVHLGNQSLGEMGTIQDESIQLAEESRQLGV